MYLKNLEKLRIVQGDDMFPAIHPDELLLLDKVSVLKPGDIILFKNRFDLKIAHRFIHSFAGYYYTRGDNCAIFNFPCKEKDVYGVIVGKYQEVERSFFLKLLLDVFLFYYIPYCLLFDIKNKSNFILLDVISRYLTPLEGIYYLSTNNNDYLNAIIYEKMRIPESQIGYYLHKIRDNNIVLDAWPFFKGGNEQGYFECRSAREKQEKEFDSIKKRLKQDNIKYLQIKPRSFTIEQGTISIFASHITDAENIFSLLGWQIIAQDPEKISFTKSVDTFLLKLDVYKKVPPLYQALEDSISKFLLNDYEQLYLYCIHLYDKGYITLKDMKTIREFISRMNIDSLRLNTKGCYQLIGFPLILVHLFDIKYQQEQNQHFSRFTQSKYRDLIPVVEQYLIEINYEFPLHLFHFYRRTKQFPVYKYLRPPRGFDRKSQRYSLFNILIFVFFKLKEYNRSRYMQGLRKPWRVITNLPE